MTEREELLKELEEAWIEDIPPNERMAAGTFSKGHPYRYDGQHFALGYLSAKRRYSKPAAQQLETEYLAEHREELEAQVIAFLDSPVIEKPMDLDHLLDDVCFHRIVLEKHLAAERARIEGEGK